MVRRSPQDVAASAEAALLDALNGVLGEAAHIQGDQRQGPDILVTLPRGSTVAIEVKAVAKRAEPGPIANALGTWNAQLRELQGTAGSDVHGVLVAEAIPDATKAILRDNGWGWLDRRGELELRAPGLIIHATDLAPSTDSAGSTSAKDPIRGRAGVSVAAALLLDPDASPGVREIARTAEIAPSSASEALANLRKASLVRANGAALIPELFWALADAWKPSRHALAGIPTPGARTRLAFGFDDLDAPGWVAGGTVAAAAWSAPVVVGSGAPPDFYVVDEAELRAARGDLHDASDVNQRACTVAVAPTALVVRRRYAATEIATSWLEWPIAHPLFVALDLAQDRSRGIEILEEWTPPAPFTRVW